MTVQSAMTAQLKPRLHGRNPFNQNFRAEVRKFLGVEWIATGPKGLAKRVSGSFTAL